MPFLVGMPQHVARQQGQTLAIVTDVCLIRKQNGDARTLQKSICDAYLYEPLGWAWEVFWVVRFLKDPAARPRDGINGCPAFWENLSLSSVA